MKMGGSLVNLELATVGVLSTEAAIQYCGGSEVLLQTLRDDYGLRPVYKNRTRTFFQVASIDRALGLMEIGQNNET